MKELLKYLSNITQTPPDIIFFTNQKIAGNNPHIHVSWEIKMFADHLEIIPPRTVHNSSFGENFYGGIHIDHNELYGSFKALEFNAWRDEQSICFEKLLQACIALPSGESACLKTLCQSIFRLMYTEIQRTASPRSRVDVIQSTVEHLESRYYHCDLSIADIARDIGYSQQYLNGKFKKQFGHSIRRELINIRLRHAHELLSAGNYLVSDVARLTGWNSAFYFSNVYKDFYGVSPSETITRSNQSI